MNVRIFICPTFSKYFLIKNKGYDILYLTFLQENFHTVLPSEESATHYIESYLEADCNFGILEARGIYILPNY